MRVTLNEADHIYTDEKGQIYKSVSSIIAQYKKGFNPNQVQANGKTLITNYTAKNGYTEQYWIDQWAEKRDYACDKGHAFHALKEMYVNNQAFVRSGKEFVPVRNQNQQWSFKANEGNFRILKPGVYTELCLWNYYNRTAGTADLVTIFPDLTFDIRDYKTNGVFKAESFQGQTMKFPCINLLDCHLGHYTLQLNLYAWMLKQYGLTPRNLEILYYDIPDEKVNDIIEFGVLPDIEPIIHEIEYDDELATAVMDLRKSELTKHHYGHNRTRRTTNKHSRYRI